MQGEELSPMRYALCNIIVQIGMIMIIDTVLTDDSPDIFISEWYKVWFLSEVVILRRSCNTAVLLLLSKLPLGRELEENVPSVVFILNYTKIKMSQIRTKVELLFLHTWR